MLGILYGSLGRKLESRLGKAAEYMGYGPGVVALKIKRIRENPGVDLRRRRKLRKNCKRLVRYVRQVDQLSHIDISVIHHPTAQMLHRLESRR